MKLNSSPKITLLLPHNGAEKNMSRHEAYMIPDPTGIFAKLNQSAEVT